MDGLVDAAPAVTSVEPVVDGSELALDDTASGAEVVEGLTARAAAGGATVSLLVGTYGR